MLKAAYEHILDLGSDQQGMCILKKCLTTSMQDDFVAWSHKIMEFVLDLVNDQYGNYLLQHVLDRAHGKLKDGSITSSICIDFLISHLRAFISHTYALVYLNRADVHTSEFVYGS